LPAKKSSLMFLNQCLRTFAFGLLNGTIENPSMFP
jgi:hypothetical protein